MTSLVALTYAALRDEKTGEEILNEHNCGVKGAPVVDVMV